jgi:hypothetical protein
VGWRASVVSMDNTTKEGYIVEYLRSGIEILEGKEVVLPVLR